MTGRREQRNSVMRNEEFQRRKFQQKCRKIFSRYDQGVRLSPEMVYSVTKEKIADNIAAMARKRGFKMAVDGCGGAGGNSIAFARAGIDVCCVELNRNTLEDAMENAAIYEVFDEIHFVQGDILKFDPSVYWNEPDSEYSAKTTVFFTSPEWGGPSYQDKPIFDPEDLNPPLSALLDYARKCKYGESLIYVPRTVDLHKVAKLGCKECLYMFLEGWCNAILLVFDTSK